MALPLNTPLTVDVLPENGLQLTWPPTVSWSPTKVVVSCVFPNSNSGICIVRRICSSYGDRYFAAAGPRLWNKLPTHLRQTDVNFEQFKPVSYTHLRAHETGRNLVCRLLLEKMHSDFTIIQPVSYTHLTLPTNREV